MSGDKAAVHGVIAEFESPAAVLSAAEKVRDAGYTHWDVYSPFPIHGAEKAMGVKPTKLPWLVLCCGLTGTSLALFFQWWTNAVDYPFLISGKPLFGIPANIPVTFEFTVLLSAFSAFFGMLIFNRLPRHHHAVFEHPAFKRVTDDGFFITIESADPAFAPQKAMDLLAAAGGGQIAHVHESASPRQFPLALRVAAFAVLALAMVPLAFIVHGRLVPSAEGRFHLVPDMDNQARFESQAGNAHYADGRAMRPDVEGTVAWGELQDDDRYFHGKEGEEWIDEYPLALDGELLAKGRERFGIYCAVCHGHSGYGDGRVAQRALDLQEPNWIPPSNLHTDVVRSRPLGQVFDSIRNGIRNMPAYGSQLTVEESWAVVAYVKALQRSQATTPDDLPPEGRVALGLD